MNANDKFIFILGSEGKGIRKLIKKEIVIFYQVYLLYLILIA